MITRTRLFLTAIILSLPFKAFALDLTDVYNTLGNAFYNMIDKNEGMTSFQSLNIPCGGREESLGSAFTGLADDICFFDYNPAASCLLKNGEVALFHNSWIADSNMETLAWADRFGDLGLGAKLKCFYTPFTEYNYFGDRVAGNYYSETTGCLNASYNFFHGYYFKGLAVGGNLKAAWRSIPDYTNNETNAVIKGSGLAQSALGLMGDVGVMMTFDAFKSFDSRDANLRVGLSAVNLGVSLKGFGSQGSFGLDDPLPSALCAGASYRLLKFLAFTADFRQPMNFQNFSKSGLWSAGIGVDWTVTNYLEFMAGFRLKGGNPRFSLGSEFKIKKFIFDVNYTFDLTSSLNPVNHFSLSARVALGDRGRKIKREMCDKYYTLGLDEYAKGNYDEAVKWWTEALKEDKSFTPAKKWIETVRGSQRLYNRVLDIQSLD